MDDRHVRILEVDVEKPHIEQFNVLIGLDRKFRDGRDLTQEDVLEALGTIFDKLVVCLLQGVHVNILQEVIGRARRIRASFLWSTAGLLGSFGSG
ncbi:hypothetical protein M8J76_016515 [Diaphorina citri]|nr:hypothetical protein M8J76_016515 [Diaphorina citri]